MAKVRYKRGLSGNLDNVPVTDGQILYATDKNELYIDTDKERGKITDTNKVDETTTIAGLTLENNIEKEDLKNALDIENIERDIEDIESKIPSEASSTNQLATQEDITNLGTVFNYKGSKQTYSELPITGNTPGDVWNIVEKDPTHGIKAGDNVIWTKEGTWDILAGAVDLRGYQKKENGKGLSTNDFTNEYKDLLDKTVIQYTLDNTIVTYKGQINPLNIEVDDNGVVAIPSGGSLITDKGNVYNIIKTNGETYNIIYTGSQWKLIEKVTLEKTNNLNLPFVAEFGITTFNEVDAAVKAKRLVFCRYENPENKTRIVLPLVNGRERPNPKGDLPDITTYSFAAPYWTNAHNENYFKGRNEATFRVFIQRKVWKKTGQSGKLHDAWEYDENYNVYVIPYSTSTTTALVQDEYNRLIELYNTGKTIVVKGVPYGNNKTYSLHMESYDDNGITFSGFIDIENDKRLKTVLLKTTRIFNTAELINLNNSLVIGYGDTGNDISTKIDNAINNSKAVFVAHKSAKRIYSLIGKDNSVYYFQALGDINNINTRYLVIFDSDNAKWNIRANKFIGEDGYITAGQKSGTTLGTRATAEGQATKASGARSHAEGYLSEASGINSHAEGQATKASGLSSHAEGQATKASDARSHAEGYLSEASGTNSHAEGYYTIASGSASHVEGRFNKADTSVNPNNVYGTYAHIVGGGTADDDRRNIYTLSWQGESAFASSVGSTGHDYAEYFEWADGNPNNEDRVGLLVTLDGEKIRPASYNDEILGIISGTVAVLGNNYENEWQGRYLKDGFGRLIYESYEYTEIETDPETGEEIEVIKSGTRPKLNPDYDPSIPYIPRSQRPEWSPVGMVGKLFLRDDGTCQVNGYVKPADGGIGTAAEGKTNIRVLKRVNENIIQVLLK